MDNFSLLKLALLLFPGVIVTSILQFFNIKSQAYNTIKFCLYSFLYGIIIEFFYFSFIFEQNIKLKVNLKAKDFEILDIIEFNVFIGYRDILFLLVISILIGLFLSFLRNSGYIHKIFLKYHITYETGFETLLHSIYHSKEKDFLNAARYYVHIKLLNGKVSYYGILKAYEDQKEYIEIFLEEVDVFFDNNPPLLLSEDKKHPESSDKIYKKDYVYLQLKPCEFHIEYIKPTKNEAKPQTNKIVKKIPIEKYYFQHGLYQLVIIILLTMFLLCLGRVLCD